MTDHDIRNSDGLQKMIHREVGRWLNQQPWCNNLRTTNMTAAQIRSQAVWQATTLVVRRVREHKPLPDKPSPLMRQRGLQQADLEAVVEFARTAIRMYLEERAEELLMLSDQFHPDLAVKLGRLRSQGDVAALAEML